MQQHPIPDNPLSRPIFVVFAFLILIFPVWGLWHALTHRDVPLETSVETLVSSAKNASSSLTGTSTYPVHHDITATLFWVGEDASKDNQNISNSPSAWDDDWVTHYGGVDDPKRRNGFLPEGFTPKENPFYIALPYNDFDKNGERRKEASQLIPWAGEQKWTSNESMLKNRWVKVTRGNKTAYAQWEDVGPFGENDASYVWGTSAPKSSTNQRAGIDLSPAVNGFLNGKGLEPVDWQFIDSKDVPDGPWKTLVTTSQVNWK